MKKKKNSQQKVKNKKKLPLINILVALRIFHNINIMCMNRVLNMTCLKD